MGYKTAGWSFADCVRESGWAPDAGPFPGVFDARAAGEHCLWTRNWVTPWGVLWAAEIAPQELAGLRYELRDLAQRGDTYAGSLIDSENEKAIRYHLSESRRRYGDFFTWPYAAPGRQVGAVMQRPGWPLIGHRVA